MIEASSGPSPNTVWVACLYRSQRVHLRASLSNASHAARKIAARLDRPLSLERVVQTLFDDERSIISSSRLRAPAISG